ncbi:helix-turn-helix transcriptional regulator [Lewinella sp. 4G2]|uniref:helix-turn-helix domain-containing protein n=1 Tax=Lewinella sp. 4G2 TaxID=1803372 RepID=UPI0007B4CDD9|nr:helix-turn-helix transcriptional regulator [Lewinella sp. 4G2]OAV43171.1 hypothetical protein A3850_001070 [Lewinella sp. 4G2]
MQQPPPNDEAPTPLSNVVKARLKRQREFAAVNRDRFNTLSGREREVLTLIAQGHSNKAISETLAISIHTVRTHRNNIWKQLNISSIVDAVWWGECFELI